MSAHLETPAELLHRRARAVRAIQGTQMNAFTRTLSVLEQVSAEIAAPLAIVGGLAGIHHGALVTTLDIDIVVPRDRLEGFLQACQKHGMAIKRASPEGWHRLECPDGEGPVEIEVIPEGGRTPRDPTDAPPIPGPTELGVARGLGYASFPGWVAMKLVANRDKDRYHLIEALKKATEGQIAAAMQHLRTLPPAYLAEFQRLHRAAEDENSARW